MRRWLIGCLCVGVLWLPACARPVADDFNPEQIIAMERAALDRWGKADPTGYFEIYAPDIVYFDPTTAARIDGREPLKATIEAIFAPFKGTTVVGRFDMQKPLVQRRGDTAVLTFNLLSYRADAGQPERVVARWNSTEVYSRIDGVWRITHSHWSYVKPELKQPMTQIN
jgi:ketosteroid isomerase-like protein